MADQDPSIQDLVTQAAIKYKVPPELALGVADQESGFNPGAVNPKDVNGEHATGVFQLLPSTAKRLGVDHTQPLQNIDGGVRYLRDLLEEHKGDREKVLAAYGGVKNDTTYVPMVTAKIAKYAGAFGPQPATLPTAAPKPVASHVTEAPPKPRTTGGMLTKAITDIAAGFDPRTSTGRGNLAGATGSALATVAMPEFALPAWAARGAMAATAMAGAYMGGATEQAGEQAVDAASGAPPPKEGRLEAIKGAGRDQFYLDAMGQGLGYVFKGVGRRVMASPVSKAISSGLDDALAAVKSRVGMGRTAVTSGQAGKLADEAFQGPVKSVKDQLGEDVGAAAKTGPMIPTAPLKARLDELSAQITPMASHTQLPAVPGYTPAQVQALATKNPQIAALAVPADHPLPGALSKISEALADHDEISFEDAHKIKRLLDDVTTWDSPAKTQVKQITKGFRQTLRESMTGHAPYDDATAAYATVAKQYSGVGADRLHRSLLTNPGQVVDKISWQNPAQAQLLKDVTLGTAGQAGPAGAQQGEAAFNAVRAAWTHENLIAKGPTRMANEIEKIEASNDGQAFIKTFYGDPAGQTTWNNLKQIATALRKTVQDTKAFSGSDLARATPMSGTVRDFALAAASGHPIGKIGALSRVVLGSGTGASEMLQWASYSNARTQFLIKHVLTGPNPGQALADMARWFRSSQEEDGRAPDAPAVSHEQVAAGGPPMPRSAPDRPPAPR